MKQFTIKLRAKLENDIRIINSEGLDKLQESIKMLVVLERGLDELKTYLLSYSLMHYLYYANERFSDLRPLYKPHIYEKHY